MGEKLIVGPVNKGLKTDVTAFNVDNDAFPTLINAYQWRGRVKRKRGTALLNRLMRHFDSTISSYGSVTSFNLVAGAGNLLTAFSLQANGNIVPGSVTFTDTTTSTVYTDPTMNGTLIGTPSGTGTINYATGAITISGATTDTITTVSFNYYPDLPVMGLEDLVLLANQFPGNLAFDTVYSYNILTTTPYSIYDVSFYANPISLTYAIYTAKTNVTPVTWNGQNYQQFWTTNYQNALWATNGINVPFSVTKIGMQFAQPSNDAGNNYLASATQTSATTVDFVIQNNVPLVVGDFVFANEFTGASASTLNFQTGYVTVVNLMTNTYTVKFPNATIGGAGLMPGILQYLTNRSDVTKDNIRFYTGDPTNGNATTPTLNGTLGWVNFMPPLSQLNYTIADLPLAQYYLVGARMIVAFKDRLLFIGPVVQTSSAGSQKYLQDTVIYSQNGSPYYTASFTGVITNAATVYNPILVPANQVASPSAFWEDQTGFGGFISAGIAQPIITVAPNEDVLLLGFTNKQTRFVYTGNDIVPFNFYIINSELGSQSTFSAITLDRGKVEAGTNGFILTMQVGAQRVDLDLPDNIFEFNLMNNGAQRVTAGRDFINEWIYFTYVSNRNKSSVYVFPTQTLQYNYRDESWAIFNESYTTYGTIRKASGETWATIGNIYLTWADWNEPWDAGSTNLLQPKVIAGNQQGFVLTRDEGTGEGTSLYIQSIAGSIITSPDHGLINNDYIVISGALGTIASTINGMIFQVNAVTENTFVINGPATSGIYLGGGLITRMYIPYIQTRQFPPSWGMARKTRLGPQQYLFTTTPSGQITLLIFLSQNSAAAYNVGPIVPEDNVVNNSLIYSTVLYTCPESTNLGLTAPNINLNLAGANDQAQTWHRMNTSLLGDTVQIGFTMSDSQMRDTTFSNQFVEIEMHGMILDLNASQLLA